MTMNKTSITSDASSSSSATPIPHAFRAQLGHILPKHALFQVHLHVEQLSNVPLVSGEFGVRWKFKNVQSGSGLLGKMKKRSASSPMLVSGRRDKGKGRMLEPHIEAASEAPDRTSFASRESRDDDSQSELDSYALQSNGSAAYGQFLTASPPLTPTPLLDIPPMLGHLEKQAEAKGMTQWAPLQSYNVKWDRKVSIVVQMDVHRETSDLLPCELKLVVMQRVVHGDPNAPRQPRLGAVYINLAEYADAGFISRRYLLRESKTNATLKLTIELEHIGGEKTYIPPPLRKGEIMASVTGLLSNNDLYQTKLARDLDLYARGDDQDYQPGLFSGQDGATDFDRLAESNGPRITENLIDAIFNPVATANDHASPFTYYDPDKAREAERAASFVERQSTHSSVDSGLTDGSESHPASVYTTTSESTGPGADQPKHWWQKMRSRPDTPIYQPFRPSTPQMTDFTSRLPL